MASRGTALLVALSLVVALRAEAEGEAREEQAARLYDAGVTAHDRGDFAAAARSFAEADQLLPNDVTLETALREALRADQPVLGMRLHARARRTLSPAPSLRSAMSEVLANFGERVAWLRVDCDDCEAQLGEETLELAKDTPVEPGPQTLLLSIGAARERVEINLQPGEHKRVRPGDKAATGPTPRAPSEGPSSGLHPAWLTIGIVPTVVFGAAALGSFIQASSLEGQLADKRALNQLDGAEEIKRDGESAEVRIYAFTALTAVSAIVTGALAIWAVDWSGGSAQVGVSLNGAMAKIAF